MAVIAFLPDRLNTPPVVWKGFTAGEFLLAAGVGFLLGIPVSIPLMFIPFVGWIAIPTCMLIMPIIVVFMGGRWVGNYKRGKPDNYVWRRLEVLRAKVGLCRVLVIHSQAWALRRTRPFKWGGTL
ncbi:TIGR03750 family conjugal transfer protein [Yersinia sp. 2544 StPb PI]|uniref:TIGR03750 family conjugal transfer protein n=1 Tax=Yersinia hibernica TaxID=2339259 RepID=A0ABX5R4A1_9GAMM|nr:MULTISPECIES: TIGR03750 family conjugal transfer protein [Yersinia]MCB5303577.1 TIGR03750 family conjugal transfer protein [Yersinia bercovieri]QAX80302.1 TIGR03750 family conjugal transfer protein [Yersinia hibernica]HEN3613535.1 TIGR03750 family conjugal transfer protein [Yersinia enterocolitica]